MGYNQYFCSYLIAQSISIVLGFSVLYEVYCKLFRNYDGIQQRGGILFGCAASVLLIVAAVTAWSAPGTDAAGG